MRGPFRQDPRDWDDEQPRPEDPAWPSVDVTDNPVVATLYGPRGEILSDQRERPPFGFCYTSHLVPPKETP